MQKILDLFYYGRKHLVTAITFLTLRIYGKEIKYRSILSGQLDSRKPLSLSLDGAKDIDALVDMAKESVRNAEDRRTVVTDKCKTLLTLGSLLLGVLGLLLPKYLAFDSGWMQGFGVAAVVLLFNAIVMLLMFFDVGTGMVVSVEQSDVGLDRSDLIKSLLNRRLQCHADLENRTDYLVELYSAARFCFLSALTIVAGLVLVSQISHSPKDEAERTVQEIRSDPSLINLLRGPRGEKGEKGDDPSLDDVINRVITNPKLRDLIQKELEAGRKQQAAP